MPNGRITIKMVYERMDDTQKELSDLRVDVARIEGKMSKNNGTKDLVIRWMIRGGLAFLVGKEAIINFIPK